jgi:nucleotide-binding universal stress UspA family protein
MATRLHCVLRSVISWRQLHALYLTFSLARSELCSMFSHILFPVDFSPRSRALNERVAWLAQRFGSLVTLLHVFEIPSSWYAASEAAFINLECFDGLRESMSNCLKHYEIGVPENRVQRLVAEGDIAGHIMDVVKDNGIDLIVMGTHGYGALQGWVFGSVTAKIMHAAPCPVWTDSPLHDRPASSAISKIVCAVELTDETVPLLQFARDFAGQLGASVQLIHSVPESETRPNKYFDFDLHRYLTESARIELAKLQREAGTNFPVTISDSGIAGALAEAAEQAPPDLVLTGRGKARRTLGRFQTHTYEIIRHAPCAVLSHSPESPNHTSSSCSAEHRGQFEADAPLLTGSRKT